MIDNTINVDDWFLYATRSELHEAVIDFIMDEPSRFFMTVPRRYLALSCLLKIKTLKPDAFHHSMRYIVGMSEDASKSFEQFYADWRKHREV